MVQIFAGAKRNFLNFVPAEAQLSLKKWRKELDYLRYLTWKAKLQLKSPTLQRPIFMLGCPRSGTTLSVKLFATHSDVVDWSEAEYVWDPHRYYDKDVDHQWDASMVTAKDKRRLHSVFEHYRQMSGKRRFINKHPRNSVRLDYIDAIFPDALYIHVLRDGRAVVNSILEYVAQRPERQSFPFGNFCKPPNWRAYLEADLMTQAAHQWREIVTYIVANKASLDDRYFEIKYEDLCADTRATYQALYEFAGLSANDESLLTIPTELNSMNSKFLKSFTVEQLTAIETIQGDLLRKLGYIL